MPTETEIKLKVPDHAGVREALRKAGGRCEGAVLETNSIYDRADGSLSAAGSALRIRATARPDGSPGKSTMTYKGPRRPGEVKIRPEIEIGIDDAERASELLCALGFVRTLRFQKRRETWTLGHCHVELDELPYLGLFVEVEGPDVGSVTEVQTKIGLAGLPPIHETYVAMMFDHCRKAGPAGLQVDFPA